MADQMNDEKNKTYNTKRKDGVLPGIILVVLGLIFLLNNYGFANIDIGKLWPLFLIIPGSLIIYKAFKER